MVATESRHGSRHDAAGAIIAAAMMLPGVAAHAEAAPEKAQIAVKVLDYRESQPGLERIKVVAPSIYLLVPAFDRWSLAGTLVADSVSGATPRYHTSVTGASRMSEQRQAGDVKITRYQDHSSYALGLSYSTEHDYRSRGISVASTFSSDDNNRTFNIGASYDSDRIGSSIDTTLAERRNTTGFELGVTQALSAEDLVQVGLSATAARGYLSDPYKVPDVRPRTRNAGVLMVRWNHFLSAEDGTLRSSYRYYGDSWGIRAHTVAVEWVKPDGPMFTWTPSMRYYTQTKARFYYDPVYDPVVGAPYPPGYFTNPPQYLSPDQRLSSFGGIAVGLKLAARFSPGWNADLKVEQYEQRAKWAAGSGASTGLDPLRATSVQLGVAKTF